MEQNTSNFHSLKNNLSKLLSPRSRSNSLHVQPTYPPPSRYRWLLMFTPAWSNAIEGEGEGRGGFVYYLNSARPDYSVWLINNAQRRCVSKDSQAEELCAQGQRMSYCCRVTMPRCPIVSIITYVKHANELCAAGERRSWFEESGGGRR